MMAAQRSERDDYEPANWGPDQIYVLDAALAHSFGQAKPSPVLSFWAWLAWVLFSENLRSQFYQIGLDWIWFERRNTFEGQNQLHSNELLSLQT